MNRTEPPGIKAALVDFALHVDGQTEIRLLRAEDADSLYDVTIRNRAFLSPWMSWIDRVIDASDTYAYLRDAERQAYDHSAFKAGIWRSGVLLGCIDLHDVDWGNGCAAIGYWLDEEHTGHGIMTRAVRLMTEYAFEALDLHRIEIRAESENASSRKIAARCGFTLEGTLRQAHRIRGTHHDLVLYALIRDDDGTRT